jgi:DNA-binding winged helix-turn-helix (wHTH) protein
MKVRFAEEFVADLETGELFRNGKRRRLQDKPFRFLELLLTRPRQLVRYDEMGRHLWPDVNVDAKHGIKVAALKVRQALGDDAHRLQCLRGRGYRLMVSDITAAVEVDSAPAYTPDAPDVYAPPQPASR